MIVFEKKYKNQEKLNLPNDINLIITAFTGVITDPSKCLQ